MEIGTQEAQEEISTHEVPREGPMEAENRFVARLPEEPNALRLLGNLPVLVQIQKESLGPYDHHDPQIRIRHRALSMKRSATNSDQPDGAQGGNV